MADQVKVFKSGTLTGADITNSNEIALVQTSPTTKAVVKDIVLTSTAPLLSDGETPATIALYNDDVKLADFDSVTGSEIIDTSSKLYYKITPTPTISGNLGYSTGATTTSLINTSSNVYFTKVSPALLTGEVTSNYPLTSDANLIVNNFDPSFTAFTTSGSDSNTVNSMSTPVFYYGSLNGNTAYYYRWDGNSTAYLYKTTATNGVATGAWEYAYSPESYAAWTADLKNNVIIASPSNAVRMIDVETGTATSKTMTNWPTASSYSVNAACNNYLFSVRSASYTTTIHLTPIDTTTTAGRQISLPDGFTIGGYTSFAACYNPTEDKYYLLIGTAPSNMRLYTATGTQVSSTSNFTAVSVGQTQALGTFGFTMDANRFIIGDSEGHFYLMSSGINYKVYMNNNTATNVKNFNQTSAPYSGWFEKSPAATSTATAALEDLAIDITCKVSGVEITGV